MFQRRKKDASKPKHADKDEIIPGGRETIHYSAPSFPHALPALDGVSPSGSMTIQISPELPCPGYSGGTINILYKIPSGMQKSYHPHPGVPYDGASRNAYIPNTPEGQCLLIRYKYAFQHGHMFLVGKSATTGKDNQVTWSTIPNRTSLKGGDYGFPDPLFIAKANTKLDELGIPSAYELLNRTKQDSETTTPDIKTDGIPSAPVYDTMSSPLVDPDLLLPGDTLQIHYYAPSSSDTLLPFFGTSPSGSMTIKVLPELPCPGYSGGTIDITYEIPSGIQTTYHPHPGVPYDGASRHAYIPNTPEGQCLLTRYNYAFQHGYMFLVGKSATTGKDNQVTWSSLPNRTSLKGGDYGFPDPLFIAKANAKLNELGIPTVSELRQLCEDVAEAKRNDMIKASLW